MNYSDAINRLKEGNIKFVKGSSKRDTSLDYGNHIEDLLVKIHDDEKKLNNNNK